MEDILETALFDAGISLEPSSSNNNGTEMQSPPKLQKMEEHSEPTPVSFFNLRIKYGCFLVESDTEDFCRN